MEGHDRGPAHAARYFAIAGAVEVTAVSSIADAPLVATVREASFAELDTDHSEVEGSCTLDLASAKISGSIVLMGGTGGGTGGGACAGVGRLPDDRR